MWSKRKQVLLYVLISFKHHHSGQSVITHFLICLEERTGEAPFPLILFYVLYVFLIFTFTRFCIVLCG